MFSVVPFIFVFVWKDEPRAQGLGRARPGGVDDGEWRPP